MSVSVGVRSESRRKYLYRRKALAQLAERVCAGEAIEDDCEVSVLFCDDAFIESLNREYRNKRRPTDVLSFEQPVGTTGGMRVLGDIVVSLETVERHCNGDRRSMREEVLLLFCHGLLHLVGYDHATRDERDRMTKKQAQYLDVPLDDAWRFGHRSAQPSLR